MSPTTDQEVVDALAEALKELDYSAGYWGTDNPDFASDAAETLARLRSRGFDIIRKE